MLKLTLAIFVSWQLAVIIFQFSDAFRKRLGAWPFYLCGLLPTWRMFGPQPVDGDYQLYYRTADPTTFTDWQLLDYDKKTHPLLTLFFNPRASLVKALREIAQEAAKAGSENNVYYQLLLNELIRELRKSGPTQTDRRLVQFEIRWKTPSTLTPLFSSHVHPY